MIIYHGSVEIVNTPEIRTPNRTLDYGSGFYLTTSLEQATDWVIRKLKGKTGSGFVNIYDYDLVVRKILKYWNLKSRQRNGLIL